MKRKPNAPLLLAAATSAIAAVLACSLTGCNPTLECGSWVFSGTVQSHPAAFPLNSAFTFNPATCGKNCDCDTDCMIQMTWVYDVTDQMNVYAASGDQDRADADGWNIDRVNGAGYGYYGLLNDGVTFYSGWNTTGGNGTPNTLIDKPSWGNNTWFYSVDAAVCFKSKTCSNHILGYYFWSWIIDNNGNASEFIIAPAWKDLDTEFQSALAGWNKWAPTSGTEDSGFSGQPVLPNAVPFPTLTDL